MSTGKRTVLVGVLIGVFGIFVVAWAIFKNTSDLAGPGAVITAAAVAGLVTLSATATWKEQRAGLGQSSNSASRYTPISQPIWSINSHRRPIQDAEHYGRKSSPGRLPMS